MSWKECRWWNQQNKWSKKHKNSCKDDMLKSDQVKEKILQVWATCHLSLQMPLWITHTYFLRQVILPVGRSVFCLEWLFTSKTTGRNAVGGVRSPRANWTDNPTLISFQLALVLSEEKLHLCHICVWTEKRKKKIYTDKDTYMHVRSHLS